MFRALLLTVILAGCATDVAYETERSWCVGACLFEYTKATRHSETTGKPETTRKPEKSDNSDK
jgi:hypothetical protein